MRNNFLNVAAGFSLRLQARPKGCGYISFARVLLIAPILVFLGAAAYAAPGIKESFSKSVITVGDRVEFILTVTLPAKADTGDLPGGVLLQAFEIKDYDLGKWVEKGGEKSITQKFSISTFTTGSYMVPPWGLKYKLEGKEISVTVPGLPLVVQSVLSGNEETPKDIRKPFAIPRKGWPVWAYVLIGAGTLAVAAGAAFFFLRRRKKAAEGTAELLLPPDVRALKALEILEREGYIRQGLPKKHYVELVEIFKDYLGGRFHVDTLDKTSPELWEQMRALPLERGLTLQLKDFLTQSDLVKFAKHVPPAERGEQDLLLVRETVEKTREAPHVDAA